jgi:hypothetical protein|tara:strand:- start:72 stop:281 length:210 start_codon:yes stop_codon:yes gene_type:complete
MKNNEYNPNEDISEEIRFSDAEQIELILEEANAYNLRTEVENQATKFMEEDSNLSQLDATVMAYSEWIK